MRAFLGFLTHAGGRCNVGFHLEVGAMDTSEGISRHFPSDEGAALLNRFCIKDVLPLATDEMSIQFHARKKLRRRLEDCLDDVFDGFSGVLDVLETEGAVISGQFALWFLEETAAREGLKEVDIFVRNGGLDEMVLSLQWVCRADAVVVSWTSRPGAEEEDVGQMGRDDGYYQNLGINSVVRMLLENEEGEELFVVIVEAVGTSPLTPILFFEPVTLRLALSSDALIVFHRDGCWRKAAPLPTGTSVFFPSYDAVETESGGFEVGDGMVKDEGHICYGSRSCPLTIRRTTDEGVWYIPFTEKAAVLAISAHSSLLSAPIVRWRGGGDCISSAGEAMKLEVVEEETCESGSPVV